MKKLRDKVETYVLKADRCWKALPIKQQRLLTKIFFGGYVLLTVIMIAGIFISTKQKSNTISIDHIGGIKKKPVEKVSAQNDMVNSTVNK